MNRKTSNPGEVHPRSPDRTGASIASVSLDLDNQWSYLKTHGGNDWEAFPSYLDIFVPRVLTILDDLELEITFFIVGQDAALSKNREALSEITKRGHEVGNHSFHHEQWLHRHSLEQVREEINQAHEAIATATGCEPKGFRGPGFTWSSTILEVLAERGYLYDASTLPTYIGPLGRWYYFRTSNLSEEEKAERSELFGAFADGRRPLKPYRWNLASGRPLLEIPVSTLPIVKIPWHMSYLFYLSRFSFSLMLLYLKSALLLCRVTKTDPSFLLHPLDLLGGDELPGLDFFPGMDITTERKILLFRRIIREFKKHFRVVNMSSHSLSLLRRAALPSVTVE